MSEKIRITFEQGVNSAFIEKIHANGSSFGYASIADVASSLQLSQMGPFLPSPGACIVQYALKSGVNYFCFQRPAELASVTFNNGRSQTETLLKPWAYTFIAAVKIGVNSANEELYNIKSYSFRAAPFLITDPNSLIGYTLFVGNLTPVVRENVCWGSVRAPLLKYTILDMYGFVDIFWNSTFTSHHSFDINIWRKYTKSPDMKDLEPSRVFSNLDSFSHAFSSFIGT